MCGVFTASIVAGVAGSAAAQPRPAVELAGGYALLHLDREALDSAGIGTLFPLGWFGEAAVPISDGLTLAAQIGGHHRSEPAPATSAGIPTTATTRVNVHTFLIGARVVGRRADGLTAFFHLFSGATRVGLSLAAPPAQEEPASPS